MQWTSPSKIRDLGVNPIIGHHSHIPQYSAYFRHQNPIGDGAMPASDLCARNPPKLRALAWQAPANQRRLHVSQGTWKFSASEPTTPAEALFFWRAVLQCELSVLSQPQLRNFNSATLEGHVASPPTPTTPTDEPHETKPRWHWPTPCRARPQ